MKKSLAFHKQSGTLGFFYFGNKNFVPFDSQPMLQPGKLPVSGFAPSPSVLDHIATECEVFESERFCGSFSGVVSLIEKSEEYENTFVFHVITKDFPETLEINIGF